MMTAPLVVLVDRCHLRRAPEPAVLGTTSQFLTRWLEPVVGEAEHQLTLSGTAQWIFAIVSAAVAVGGIVLAWLIYDRQRLKAVEPELFAHAWYYDEAVSAFMGGPGYEAFDDVVWVDEHVVDGAVNGVGKVSHPERPRPASCCSRATSATTPSASASVPSCCSAGS